MKTLCNVPGCARAATGYGRLCSAHKSRRRRHGHPQQATITSAMLRPYRRIVTHWIDARPNADDIWMKLDERWQVVVRWTEETKRLSDSGRPMYWPERSAAQEALKLHQNVDAREVIVTIVAMVYMLQADPRLFRDDDAFRAQLVRRVRGLTDVNAGTWFDHEAGGVKRVYRDVPPRVVAVLSAALIDAVGVVGIIIHRKTEARAKQERENKMALPEILEVGQ